jgi:arsenate reductase (glutaredoxin)
LKSALSPITVYGIENCDQIRKAKSWLNRRGCLFQFHDYRKQGLTEAMLQAWLRHVPWDSLLNKRGTTWRQLDEARRSLITDQGSAVDLMLENPTLVKRPILVQGDDVLVGFSEAVYDKHFPAASKP